MESNSTKVLDVAACFEGHAYKSNKGCLIVQIVDHRTAAHATDSKTNSANEKNVPFSIHNHNEHLTPSPYVPYPNSNDPTTEEHDTNREGANSASNAVNSEAQARNSGSAQNSKVSEQARKITTVLFPTPLSLQAEVAYYATTPDLRSNNRKQSTAGNVPRTPASATMPHPPTPLSAVPSTPLIAGPPNKKQKMLVGTNDIRNFESKIVDATAGPLFLEPVDNLHEAQKLINEMTDSRHKEDYPAPKTRKRTVAELAADEALAAQEERFMLIMDERLAASASAGAAGKANGADGEVGAVGFERFKLIEQIKAEQQAKKQREREQVEQRNAMQAAAKAKQDKENEARQAREQLLLQEQRQAQEHARSDNMQQLKQSKNQAAMLAMQQQEQLRRQQQQQAANQRQTSQPPNGVMPTSQPNVVPASQAHQSPVVRNMTPHSNSSPTVGHVSGGQSQPMNITSSQGVTSSPARPTSALPHGHPQAGGVAMVHQRSAQGPSRRGTPQMSNGTPSMAHVTPVMNSSTPVSRMAHSSPPHTMTQTPVMAPNTIAAQHIGMGAAQGLTPQQIRQVQTERERQAALAQQQRHQNHQQQLALQNGHPTQMSPERMNLQYQHQQAQQAQLRFQAHQQAAYQDNMRKHQLQQSAGHVGSPHLGQSQPQPGQAPHGHPGQQQLHPSQVRTVPPHIQQQIREYQIKAYNAKLAHIAGQYGGTIPPDKLPGAKATATQYAQHMSVQQRHHIQAKASEVEQHRRMMMQAHMGSMGAGMMGGGQVNGGGGMNGQMNGMGMGINGMGMQ